MTIDQKKDAIKNHVVDMITWSHKRMLKKIDKAINSGALDIENWQPDNSPMVIPKTIMIAILQEEADQYSPKDTSYERKVNKAVRNLKMFL